MRHSIPREAAHDVATSWGGSSTHSGAANHDEERRSAI
jgi:hypothetical protein